MEKKKIYIAGNMYGISPSIIMKERDAVEKKIKSYGFEPLHICDYEDFFKSLEEEKIIEVCFKAIGKADIFLMYDADKPGWGKIFEMNYAIEREIPILLIAEKGFSNPWMNYYSTEIFDSLDKALDWIKINYGEEE